jgi:hypothetical protein
MCAAGGPSARPWREPVRASAEKPEGKPTYPGRPEGATDRTEGGGGGGGVVTAPVTGPYPDGL